MQAQSRPADRSSVTTLGAAAAVVVVIGLGIWGIFVLLGGGPVPADEARIEVAFTGDGTSFVGDREIVEGTVTVTFSNETDSDGILYVMAYETGSDALAVELEMIEVGGSLVTSDPPVAGYTEVLSDWPASPGTHSYTVDMEAGNTYLFDAGFEDYHQSGIWRMAVIEVVAP